MWDDEARGKEGFRLTSMTRGLRKGRRDEGFWETGAGEREKVFENVESCM